MCLSLRSMLASNTDKSPPLGDLEYCRRVGNKSPKWVGVHRMCGMCGLTQHSAGAGLGNKSPCGRRWCCIVRGAQFVDDKIRAHVHTPAPPPPHTVSHPTYILLFDAPTGSPTGSLRMTRCETEGRGRLWPHAMSSFLPPAMSQAHNLT